MRNYEIARILEDIAALLELKNESVFKIRAYQKAARSIEQQSVELEKLLSEGRLREVPGIGEAIAKKIEEIIATGKLEYYERLKAEFPTGINALLEIPGIGPRKALAIASNLNVKTVDELEAAIRDGRVASLHGMGEKTAENLMRHIQDFRRKKSESRILLGEALNLVDTITDRLNEVARVDNLVAAGSLRRFRETIGDIDLMGATDTPEDVIDAFTTLGMVKHIQSRGPTKASVIVNSGLQVDLRIVEPEAFGSLLQYFTGSKQHNINLRERARRLGLSLSEYGITNIETGHLEKFATEEAFYARQGLAYIPPELREGQQEIEAAEKDALPRLITRADIKGDLHMHTDWSDGRDSLEKMALEAKALGYQYIAICDHSVGRAVSRGLDEERLRQQMAEIRSLNERIDGLRVLCGIEIDIMADGSLDTSDDILAGMDFVIAAVHSSLRQPREAMTPRLLRAIENPNVDAIAHPTGRLLLEREPVDVDLEEVFQACARNGTMLEINCMPDRLDLRDIHAYRARELGVKLLINTDSHRAERLRYMNLGVGVARRAWCRSEDVMNTRPLDELLGYLARRGQG